MPQPFHWYEIKSIANSKWFSEILRVVEESFFNKTQDKECIDNKLLRSFFGEFLSMWCGFSIKKDDTVINLNGIELIPIYASIEKPKIMELSEMFKIPVKIKDKFCSSILDTNFLKDYST